MLYFLQVLASVLLLSTSFAHKKAYQTALKQLLSRQKLSKIQSLVTEYSFLFLATKLFLIYEWGSESTFFYNLDISLVLILWALSLQALFSRQSIYELTKFMRTETSSKPPSLFTWSFWLRFTNPVWQSRSILIHQDVIYVSDSELRIACDKSPNAKRDLSLDILQHPSFPRSCPVVVYIHSGNWCSGSKSERPPVLSYLALKRCVVVSVNYRFSTIPNQICDIKRALEWIKGNISRFGGDEGFVMLMGGGAGGHLASMVGLSENCGIKGYLDNLTNRCNQYKRLLRLD
jgi:Carboxylesterase family